MDSQNTGHHDKRRLLPRSRSSAAEYVWQWQGNLLPFDYHAELSRRGNLLTFGYHAELWLKETVHTQLLLVWLRHKRCNGLRVETGVLFWLLQFRRAAGAAELTAGCRQDPAPRQAEGTRWVDCCRRVCRFFRSVVCLQLFSLACVFTSVLIYLCSVYLEAPIIVCVLLSSKARFGSLRTFWSLFARRATLVLHQSAVIL